MVFGQKPKKLILARAFSRDILKGGNIDMLAGGRGSWGCIIFWGLLPI